MNQDSVVSAIWILLAWWKGLNSGVVLALRSGSWPNLVFNQKWLHTLMCGLNFKVLRKLAREWQGCTWSNKFRLIRRKVKNGLETPKGWDEHIPTRGWRNFRQRPYSATLINLLVHLWGRHGCGDDISGWGEWVAPSLWLFGPDHKLVSAVLLDWYIPGQFVTSVLFWINQITAFCSLHALMTTVRSMWCNPG